MAYTKYSLTPANNNATPPDGAPEGMLPSAVNDTMRDMMAQIRDVGDGIRNGTYTMTAPVITGGSITGVALSGNTFTNPVITGGSINNTPIGGSTAAAGTFTSLSDSGNLTFTGTGNRITGDFSNATASSQVAFQSSTTNGQTNVYIAPNGTSTTAAIRVTNDSSLANFSSLGMAVTNTTALIQAAQFGSGSFLPLAIQTGGSERLRIDSSGNVGIGTSSPSTYGKFVVNGASNADAGIFIGNQSLTGSAPTYKGTVRIIDNPTSSTGTSGGIEFLTSTFGSGYGWKIASIDSSGVQLTFATRQNSASWTEAMRIDSSGNVGIGTSSSNLSSSSTALTVNTGTAANFAAIELASGGTLNFYINANNSASYIDSRGTRPMVFYTNSAERMRITSDGNLLVGTTSVFAGTNLQLSIVGPTTTRGTLNLGCTTNQASGTAGSVAGYNGTTYTAGFDFTITGTSSGQISTFTNNAGSVTSGPYVAAGGTSWTSSSDETLKDIIEPITNATEKLLTLRTVVGKYKQDPTESKKLFLIAQDVDKVFPEVVVIGNDDKLGLNYQELIPVLVASIKEQQEMIEELKQEVAALKASH